MSIPIKLIEGYQVNPANSKSRIRKKLLKKTYKIPFDFFTNDKRPKLVTSFKNLYTDVAQIIASKSGTELKLRPGDIMVNDETKSILESLLFNQDRQEDMIEIIQKYLGSGVIASHEDFVIFLNQPDMIPIPDNADPASQPALDPVELRIYMSKDHN